MNSHQLNIPAETFEELMKCPYCASLKIEKLLSAPDRIGKKAGLFHLSQCRECGLVFQNPRVKEAYIGDYYTNEIGYTRAPRSGDNKLSAFQKLRRSLWEQTMIQHFGYTNMGNPNFAWRITTALFQKVANIQLIPKFVEGGKLLEIGCSNGLNLERLKKYGWDVEGVEMGRETAEYARKHRGLRVHTGRIEDMAFKENSFDAVVMGMVLEHLYDPFEKLIMVNRWLKPGGQLLFSIPWFEGFEFQAFKEYAYGLQLPTHITFMNEKALNEFLEKLGYGNIQIHHHFFDRDIVASAGYKYGDTKKWRHKFIAHNKTFRLLGIKPFVFLLSLLGKTSRVSVSAKKMT